jgi:hypothetical protein
MRSRVKLAMANKTNIDDTIDRNLNEATLQHTLRVRPKEMQTSTTFSTTGAIAEYGYGISDTIAVSDLYAFLYVRDSTDDVPLVQGNETEWNDSRQSLTDTALHGDPRRWLHIERKLVLYAQIPDSTSRTIKVRYLKRPATMTSSVDFPLNDEHIRPVEQLAKHLTWLDLGNEEKAIAALNSYEALLATRQQPLDMEDMSPEFRFTPVHNLIIED